MTQAADQIVPQVILDAPAEASGVDDVVVAAPESFKADFMDGLNNMAKQLEDAGIPTTDAATDNVLQDSEATPNRQTRNSKPAKAAKEDGGLSDLEKSLRDLKPPVEAVEDITKTKEDTTKAEVEHKPEESKADGKPLDEDGIESPKNAHPKTSESFEKLRTLSKQRKQEAEALAAEREALKKELEEIKTKGTMSEEDKKAIEEARRIRTEFKIETDPDFRAKYDDPIDNNTQQALDRVLDFYPDPSAKAKITELVKSLGGVEKLPAFDAFMASPGVPRATKDFISRMVVDNEILRNGKENAIKKAKENWTKYEQEYKVKETKAVEQSQAEKQKWEEDAEKAATETKSKITWWKKQEILSTDSADEKARKAKANELIDVIEPAFKRGITTNDPKERAQIAILACAANKFFCVDKPLYEAKIAELTRQIETMKSSTRTARAGIGASTNVKPRKAPVDINRSIDFEANANELFAKLNQEQNQ